ncbi:hypothetical protein SSX86_020243 [Deinandra increscens subsp. villosa]|uniref:Calcium-transporting ATPase n=1 Tax=Deinandra increscens subsp. villosa TaxID=3103831 RepID=A0AAP0CMM6_9ASTR
MSSGILPYRRSRDVESGGDWALNPFDIARTKSAPVDRLQRWRKSTHFVLNASRRFRYTLDLKKEEENRRIRTHAQIIRAAYHFQAAYGPHPFPIPTGDYGVGREQLAAMTRDHDFAALQYLGGVCGLAEKLNTNLDKGIHEDESNILDRKNVFGTNTYPWKKRLGFWRILLDACRDKTLIILTVAAVASFVLGTTTEGIKEGWYDGGSIGLSVIITIAVTAISDYKQALQFQIINEEKQNIQLEVVRGGRRVKISIFDIVVGDVIPLKIGDQVPADGVLISGHSLAIDESSMTGESKIVNKDHKSPFLMSGCKVADGYGTMLATSVGIDTEWGLLMACISEDNGEETPLQVYLNGVANIIGLVGFMDAISVLIALLARYFIAGKTSVGDAFGDAIKIFTFAVTIVVVAVPEGLPLAITLTLAHSMHKMMADNALVRRLYACEVMGSATTICSDKTGTLTLNLMTVTKAYVCGKKIDHPNNMTELPSGVVSLLVESVAQNTTGSVFSPEGGKDVEVSGSPTEKAILQWGLNLGMNFEAVRLESSVIHVFPFNSEKKRGGVAVKRSDSEVHVHWKGAAEIVLAACTRYMDSNEQLVPLDEGKVEYFNQAIEDMAGRSLRCVAIAYAPLRGETVPTDEEELANWELPEDELVLLAIVGLKDPCRPGVQEAVQLCVKAGIKVRMVTGDNLQTAKAIALECGILGSDADTTEPNLIEGKSFRALSDAQRLEIAERISVMGRSSPKDKLLLVQALRKLGHVVAVTGDGTNDAPALHEADIGLAMGIQGTEVAKESSDIIILDDNFTSVVKVVRWGRSVYANIQKFIHFQFTLNAVALIINFVVSMSSGDVLLNAVQLLWVNLIMDTLGALMLATEQPTDYLMDHRATGRREPLITNIMWRNLLIQIVYQVSVLLVLNFRGREILHSQYNPNEKKTLIFNAFVFAQIFNLFNARKPDEINFLKGVTKNQLFMRIVAFIVVLQVVIVMFLGKFASTVRLSWQLWLVSIAIGFISWPLSLIGKLIPVPERPFGDYFINIFAYCTKPRNQGSSSENGDNS